MKTEFNIGDKVTFKPYEKAISAIVLGIEKGGIFKHKDDGRIFYTLGGDCHSVCTGKCIVESQYFEPWTPEKAKNSLKTNCKRTI